MCVLLCANPKVYDWLDLPSAIEYRQSLQASPADPATRIADRGEIDEVTGIAADQLPRIMKRSAWLQTYFERMSKQTALLEERQASTEDRHEAFEAIAHAWSRLLALVGLRR